MKFSYIFSVFLLFGLFACSKDFEEINTNPNFPVDGEPGLLLRQVIYNIGDEMSYEGFVAGNLLAQQFTMVDFNLFDRHDLFSPQLGGSPWPSLYRNLLDNEIILDISKDHPRFSVYEGPALIMKSYMTSILTDLYGDIPYQDALNGLEGTTNPVYDLQEEIYLGENGILNNLKKAIELIDAYNGAEPLEGDILFQGDLEKWIQFSNSLRVKYLIRISGRVDVSTELQSIYEERRFIATNEDNAVFPFSAERPNSFRMQQLRDGDFNLFVMSETMQEVLESLEDPRASILFRPSVNDNVYNGLLNGPDASQTSISINDFSLPNQIFREQTNLLQANFMTAWETNFLLAEAASKGLISEISSDLYEAGVSQAFNYWNTEMPDSYLSGPAALSPVNELEQIITQKWIASCINGYEPWIEYRRTGYPQLKTVGASLNNGLIPVRMPYPADEATLNPENFNVVVGAQGNDVNRPVWWDIQ